MNKKTSFRPTFLQIAFGALGLFMLMAFSTSHARGFRILTAAFSASSSVIVGPAIRHK